MNTKVLNFPWRFNGFFLLIILVLAAKSNAAAQFFTIPDFNQMMKQAETQAKAQYEATGPAVVLWDDNGNRAIVRNVWGLSSGNYLYIKINERGKDRIYRPNHNESTGKAPTYAKGDGCVINIKEDRIDLRTPINTYVFTHVKALQGVGVPSLGINDRQNDDNLNTPQSHKVCRSCNGTGKCGNCQGKGYFYGYEMNRISCPSCTPSNGRICNVCNGTGRW